MNYLPGRWPLNVVLRVIGFGLLVHLIVLVPVYKIFGLSWVFWTALAVCLVFTGWSYFAYRRIFAVLECPKCSFKMNYLQVKKAGTCPKCGNDLRDLADQ
jgi:hypothetical protein